MNKEELLKIKQKALENHIPIIMDDTIEVISKILKEREPEKILEIGTAVGYSAICFSEYLSPNGKIDTIERDEEREAEAIENIKKVGVEEKINLYKGDAVEILPTLNEKYDVVFIDAAKGKYPFFLEQALRMLKDDGIILADNILYKGYVMSDYNKHKQRTAVTHLRQYIKETTENPELETEILEIGDGLAISRKRKELKMKKPELLAPAGSFEKAKIAFMYGADAVYCGTASLSLRSRAEVDDNDLEKTIQYAHSIGKKVYAALNIYAWDSNYEEIEKQVKMLDKVKVDAIIASDGGVIQKIKEIAPDIEIHVSTQANVVSYHAAKFWYDNGTSRVILGRETSKEQIEEIMKNKPKDLEVEMFIHGALCWAYSGRCFLSEYLSCRSANLGDCSQSCRWAYNMYLEEKNKPGNLMPVETDENGTYILSSKDLCLIKEIPQIVEIGVDSLKIEGRLKTEYYLASVVNVYRNAIDDYIANPEKYDYKKYLKELEKVKTRGLTTFYFNDRNNKDFQEYEGKQYNPNYEFGGKVLEDYKKEEIATIEIKNKLTVGDELEVLIPHEIEAPKFKIEKLYDSETGEEIQTVNPGKAGQTVKMNIPFDLKKGWILRRKKAV